MKPLALPILVIAVITAIPLMFLVSQPSSPTPDYTGVVEWVIDGDTIIVDGVHIRLLSIDAPELDTAAGRAAAAFMVDLVAFERVELTCTTYDKYDRLLCDVWLDGHDVGAILVNEGLARVWR